MLGPRSSAGPGISQGHLACSKQHAVSSSLRGIMHPAPTLPSLDVVDATVSCCVLQAVAIVPRICQLDMRLKLIWGGGEGMCIAASQLSVAGRMHRCQRLCARAALSLHYSFRDISSIGLVRVRAGFV